MSAAQDMLARMRAGRSHWVDLGDGLAVQVTRPTIAQASGFFVDAGFSMTPEQAGAYVTDWRGFTPAVLLGPALGAGDVAVPFDSALWAEWSADQPGAAKLVTQKVVDIVAEFFKAQSDAAKNL